MLIEGEDLQKGAEKRGTEDGMQLANGVQHPHSARHLRSIEPAHPLEVHLLIGQGEGHGLQIPQTRHDLPDLSLAHFRRMGPAHGHRLGKPGFQIVVAICLGRILEDVPGVHYIRPVGRDLHHHDIIHLLTGGDGSKAHPLQAFSQLCSRQIKSYQPVGLRSSHLPAGGRQIRAEKVALAPLHQNALYFPSPLRQRGDHDVQGLVDHRVGPGDINEEILRLLGDAGQLAIDDRREG